MADYVIRPPTKNGPAVLACTEEVVRLVVDSRDRNMDQFPDPARYDLRLNDDIEYIVSAELAQAHVPLDAAYVVGAGNNVLHVNLAGQAADQATAVEVPVGDYSDPATLAAALTSALSGAGFASVTASYDTATQRFSFQSSSVPAFQLCCYQAQRRADGSTSGTFPKRSIAQTLGFGPPGIFATDGAGQLRAPFRYNYDLNRYAVLHIEGFKNNASPAQAVDGSFAIVGAANRSVGQSDMHRMVFKPPIAKLSRLQIQWLDYYGNPVDFQGRDHRLELLLTCEKSKLY